MISQLSISNLHSLIDSTLLMILPVIPIVPSEAQVVAWSFGVHDFKVMYFWVWISAPQLNNCIIFQTHPQLSTVSALPSHFMVFGASSNCPLLLPSSILDSFQSDGLIFHCHIFFLFILLVGVLGQEYWSVLPFPPPVDHVLLELFTVTCPALLTASLNCASHFAMARQWSMKQGN